MMFLALILEVFISLTWAIQYRVLSSTPFRESALARVTGSRVTFLLNTVQCKIGLIYVSDFQISSNPVTLIRV